MPENNKTRIMIVEDHPVFRLGMRELINHEQDLFVCGDAEDITGAWKKIESLVPDMVIVDISLKGRNGIELIKSITKHYKDMPVLVLSMHDEALYAERSFQAGAKGYIMKQSASESIIKAIRCVIKGKTYASDALMENILNKFTGRPQSFDKSPLDILANRELEVLHMIGDGFTTKEIAEKLNLSTKTISTYRERIKEKLNLKNASELMRYAVSWVKK
ncbi:Putative oxygen regulatory protein, NreC-like [Desulfonema limicola]|uniref:Oxygen regulatory protein, NreC-like n=1 Tax=Desulfonema limicola TaxID=45656 RepID=A0A975GGU1_9BACT|nr:response regulator transcription factor [Desulfonema limicola]QTA80577.1 Putative oxygen regulatory protein, NreC-like [Desulfonema limicola]